MILIRFGELWLKSEPVKRRFIDILNENMRNSLNENNLKAKIINERGRIFVECNNEKKALDTLKNVFGISSVSIVVKTDLKNLEKEFLKFSKKNIRKNESFAVRVKREGKHKFTSKDLEVKLGQIIVDKLKNKVNLSNPDKTIFVEVRDDKSYLFTEKIKGAGGLPLGAEGKVVSLLSGGIDSPVSTYMIMKRGCVPLILFAYFPRGGDESDIKRVKEVVKVLRKYSSKKMRVFIFRHEYSLAEFRKKFPKYTCILCRRMMYRIANDLAKKQKAKAIVTGENLGQVASQTLDNLRVIDEVSELPVFRPVIGFDKIEIEKIAREIGTFEKSIIPVSSGCGKFEGCWARPKKPSTKARLKNIFEMEKKMDIDNLVRKSLDRMKEISDLFS